MPPHRESPRSNHSCGEACVFQAVSGDTYRCQESSQLHTCGATCTLRSTRLQGVVCPASGIIFERTILCDSFGQCEAPELPILKPAPPQNESQAEILTFIHNLLPGIPPNHQTAYVIELHRLRAVYAPYMACALGMHVLGFLYALREGIFYGGHTIGAQDPLLIAHLPPVTELEAYGFKRIEMTRGKCKIITALEAMNKPSATAPKRVKREFSIFVANNLPSQDVLVRDHAVLVAKLDKRDALMQSLF